MEKRISISKESPLIINEKKEDWQAAVRKSAACVEAAGFYRHGQVLRRAANTIDKAVEEGIVIFTN